MPEGDPTKPYELHGRSNGLPHTIVVVPLDMFRERAAFDAALGVDVPSEEDLVRRSSQWVDDMERIREAVGAGKVQFMPQGMLGKVLDSLHSIQHRGYDQ